MDIEETSNASSFYRHFKTKLHISSKCLANYLQTKNPYKGTASEKSCSIPLYWGECM